MGAYRFRFWLLFAMEFVLGGGIGVGGRGVHWVLKAGLR